MKKLGYKVTLYSYLVYFIIILITCLIGISIVFYLIRIQKPNGESDFSNWPNQYTESFKEKIVFIKGMPSVTQEGIENLRENKLWIQIINEEGQEVFNYNKPKSVPTLYLGKRLMALCEEGGESTPTICLGEIKLKEESWTYIIGYPIKISKITTFVNGNRVVAGKKIISILLLETVGMLIICGLGYGYFLTKHIFRMIKGIRQIAIRAYIPMKSKGIFNEVYESLNELDGEIRKSDEIRSKNNQMREEWIENITHDLKTPLSPIKGYAELMVDEEQGNNEEERQYAQIILKNAIYIEALVNDLKLTYQLESGILPLRRERKNLVRLLKEQVIELLNHPEYKEAELQFEAEKAEIWHEIDPLLFKRAIQNLIVNAIVHNEAGTAVSVVIYRGKVQNQPEKQGIIIEVNDAGKGMSNKEVSTLFERYYRGSSKEKVAGTGLGMAITKQIIESHGGEITVRSEIDAGTHITIYLKQ